MVPGQGEDGARLAAVLKRDALGRVELLDTVRGPVLRRVACGGRLPGSRLVARHLARRERIALHRLAGLPGVPRVVDDPALEQVHGPDGRAPRAGDSFLRSFVAGRPLHRAERLALDFFDHLDALVEDLHRAGVCHNDLHKEQNVVVDEQGFPALIDFQLASLERPGSRRFRVRCRDDLRHVQKHRRRYTRDGRGPEQAGVGHGRGRDLERRGLARLWRRFGKPLYNGLTRGLLGTRDGEERRPSSGPWPRWEGPLGPRPGPPPPPPTRRAGPA